MTKTMEIVEGLITTIENAEVIGNKLQREVSKIKSDESKMELVYNLELAFDSMKRVEKLIMKIYDSINVKIE